MVAAIGEATSDGDTTLTRTPWAASSLASVKAIASSAAFDALYGPLPAPAVRVASELIVTTLAAPPRATDAMACHTATNPSEFTCHNCWNSSSGVSMTGRLVEPTPA